MKICLGEEGCAFVFVSSHFPPRTEMISRENLSVFIGTGVDIRSKVDNNSHKQIINTKTNTS